MKNNYLSHRAVTQYRSSTILIPYNLLFSAKIIKFRLNHVKLPKINILSEINSDRYIFNRSIAEVIFH